MFESDDYAGSEENFTRTFYFPRPLVTTKIKLDNMEGAPVIVTKIELLGIDTVTKHRQQHPFSGGTVFSSG